MSRVTLKRIVALPTSILHAVTSEPTSAEVTIEDSTLESDWDLLRSEATSNRERAEIDAIFGRHAA
jgi:hypothetical protein